METKIKEAKLWRRGPVLILMGIIFMAAGIFNLGGIGGWRVQQQYVLLAKSFLAGKTYFLELPNNHIDLIEIGDRHYWPLGPLPAVLLVFPVWITGLSGQVFGQGQMEMAMLLGVFGLSYCLARKFKYSPWFAGLLGFAFCFGSVFQIAAFISASWYLVQAFTVFLTLAAIGEWLTLKRYWVIGMVMGAVFAGRFTAGLGVIFFLLEATLSSGSIKEKVQRVGQLTAPIVVVGWLLLMYNQARFGDMWNNGYVMANDKRMTSQQRYELLNYGLFRLRNIPTNLYYYFVKSLDPVTVKFRSDFGNTYVLKWPFVEVGYPGVGFFITSPIFLYIIRANLREKMTKLAAITSVIILFVLLTYYWPGWVQVGPRYLMDLLPFIYLIVLRSFPGQRLPVLAQGLIMGSAYLNLGLVWRLFSR